MAGTVVEKQALQPAPVYADIRSIAGIILWIVTRRAGQSQFLQDGIEVVKKNEVTDRIQIQW